MGDAACDGDSGDGKPAGLLQQEHDQEAEKSTCHGISSAKEPGKQQTGDQNPNDVDRQCVARAQIIQGDDDHQVGDPQFDAGNGRREGDQEFNVRKNQRQRDHECGQCCAPRVAVV